MTIEDKLHREIEIRIWRETIYTAASAFLPFSIFLDKEIVRNDIALKEIHKFLAEHGDEWERHLDKEGYWK